MRRDSKITALVLAAGYSSRAPAFKPLLPLGNTTIIEKVLHNFRRAGIQDVTVVVGHRAEELIPVLDRLHVRYVFNEQYDQGMFSSVVAGLRSIQPWAEAFFLLPVDMPLVKSHTIRLLCRACHKTKADVIYPVFQGRRGHPPLITARCFPAILAEHNTEGLRPILERYEATACNVEVLDEGILLDADTAEDYRKILEYHGRRDIPSQAECNVILNRLKVSDRVRTHGRLVADVARKLAVHLNRAGLQIDVNLVFAAGTLHDLAKGQADHARLGAKMLKNMGYPKVAKIVAVHHDIDHEADLPPDEAAVVYLADKLVQSDCIVSINERFAGAMERYAVNAGTLEAIMQRRLNAQNIGQTVERIVGADLAEIIIGNRE